MSESTGTRVPRKQGVPPKISGSLTITDSRPMEYLQIPSLARAIKTVTGHASDSGDLPPQSRSCATLARRRTYGKSESDTAGLSHGDAVSDAERLRSRARVL